eukprot:5045052-Pyramimonas_sp.AAC.1
MPLVLPRPKLLPRVGRVVLVVVTTRETRRSRTCQPRRRKAARRTIVASVSVRGEAGLLKFGTRTEGPVFGW